MIKTSQSQHTPLNQPLHLPLPLLANLTPRVPRLQSPTHHQIRFSIPNRARTRTRHSLLIRSQSTSCWQTVRPARIANQRFLSCRVVVQGCGRKASGLGWAEDDVLMGFVFGRGGGGGGGLGGGGVVGGFADVFVLGESADGVETCQEGGREFGFCLWFLGGRGGWCLGGGFGWFGVWVLVLRCCWR